MSKATFLAQALGDAIEREASVEVTWAVGFAVPSTRFKATEETVHLIQHGGGDTELLDAGFVLNDLDSGDERWVPYESVLTINVKG